MYQVQVVDPESVIVGSASAELYRAHMNRAGLLNADCCLQSGVAQARLCPALSGAIIAQKTTISPSCIPAGHAAGANDAADEEPLTDAIYDQLTVR